ncbi:MAG: crossover junction endodeoxyribonuclease RuvC [Gemmatimonadota bacterium]|nr:MAG: crossover junction endodeoxyribonuclease RuvC [Gemmatimonadota bacterium]
MRVVGIDPGLATTGYGIVEPAQDSPGRLVECGVIRTDSSDDIACRLKTVYDGVSELIARHHPTAMAVETVFYRKNVKTTVSLGQVRGVILLCAARAGIDVSEFTPATVKKHVVGAGGALKGQIGYMVQQLLRLKHPPRPSDAADACAIALTYLLNSRARS